MKTSISFLLVAMLAACAPSASRISGRPCTGCFDDDGTCLPGTSPNACGGDGVMCTACGQGLACEQGQCVMSLLPTGMDGGGEADAGLEDCSEAAKLIYVVDQDRTLSSFDPRRIGQPGGPFVDLGRLSCPAKSGAEPFSMSVDRNATAWVVYDSGELFTVNVRRLPLTCTKTSFSPHAEVAKFGMGFVSDAPGSRNEKLFIAGSDFGSSLTSTKFGTLATTEPHTLSILGVLPGAPELTGTGDSKLWAFSPNLTTPKVARLSKTNGAVEQAFELPTLGGSPRAWAFAFWGGDFYIFLERATEGSTRVWKMNGQTGAVTLAVPDTGRVLVGAGVSTCAPVEIN
jgi:hypothetical protein